MPSSSKAFDGNLGFWYLRALGPPAPAPPPWYKRGPNSPWGTQCPQVSHSCKFILQFLNSWLFLMRGEKQVHQEDMRSYVMNAELHESWIMTHYPKTFWTCKTLWVAILSCYQAFWVFPYGIDVQLSSRALDENYRWNTWTVELFLCWAGEKQVYQEDLR